ncbi:MAG TPA: response regulator [Planctomycetaceae bacterium]|nr:response regulator [Planctomycetaceae bacterium]
MKRVLDVGQCVPDHSAIRRLLEDEFDVQVERTHERDDTLAALRRGPVDLVLINRKLDIDYSDGLEILKEIKADPAFTSIPVMLVSNYPDAQEEAVGAGAEPGFGKAQLGSIETFEKLRKFLEEPR